jgi:1-acyl-sn-glycerol-3-phosphate acyltransferase
MCEMPHHEETPPARFSDRLHLLLRVAAVVAAGAPSTTLIPLPLTQALTRRFRREELLKRLHLMVPWARFCIEHICEADLDIRGQQNLPRPSRGHMYISNHQSYVDILILMAALDTVAFLSKGIVRRIPVVGRSAYCGGTVFFERGSKEERNRALQETLRMCQQSTAVVVFPEGTRSDDGELRPTIYPRAIQEAWRRGVRVVPVGLDGTGAIIPKSMDRVGPGQPVAIRIGPARDPDDFDSAEAFTETCWSDVKRLFEDARVHRRFHMRPRRRRRREPADPS